MTPIPSGREPFEIALLSAISLYGLLAVVAYDKVAVTTLRSLPGPWGYIFIAASGAAALVALSGALMVSITGLLVEKIGLWAVSGLYGAFAIWSIGLNGARSTGFAVMLLGVALAALVRVWQINRSKRVSTTAAGLIDGENG